MGTTRGLQNHTTSLNQNANIGSHFLLAVTIMEQLNGTIKRKLIGLKKKKHNNTWLQNGDKTGLDNNLNE